jgi:hypothetical protein
LGNILEDLGRENVFLLPFGHILWQIGTLCGHVVYIFPLFGMLYQENSGNPDW